ncbi:unnamed protein product [Nippostrongylus brasiliensis]|uniref:Endo/exonuclease/phosphatase domain-containing protein n=1 Tax=Nippostrongylus brasiliensis TaxID=27835 RepID=A0A0N4YV63_NIPBR|nr:unnamed protein product [Nippostrongylus brasiliensis]
MTICTYNARTLASDASVEDLMMQARKIKYDVIGLTETRRNRPLHAVFDTGEELFLGTCDRRGVGGIGVLVNTNLAMNIDSFEQHTTRIGQRMLADFDHACGKIGLQLNLTKSMFMRNGYVSDAPFLLIGTNISECSSYVYLGREVNMTNGLSPELGRRKRAAWGASKSVEEVERKTKNARLRAHLFDSTVLPALTYPSESWALRKQDEHAICVAQRSTERRMLGVTRFIQAKDGIRSSELRRQSKVRDAVAWAKLS